ncbi:MAG TPA: energy transducer TonB [Sphingobium sp.]|uniref:energy transducer TonB n=1 Tax=Sphingobium sp. TaxID=1912891 RepID=UPI002ED0A510
MATTRSFSRPDRPALSIPAMASLAVNGLLVAVLLTLGAGRQERWTDSPALTVLSLAALKGSEQGEEQAPTAEPQAPAPSQPQSPPELPPVAPQAPAVALPPVPPLPSPLARPANPSPPVAAVTTPVAAQSPASSLPSSPAAATQGSSRQPATPQRRGVADGLDADAPAGKSLAYAAKIRSWLYAHKIYPRRARMQHEEGIVRVRFILDRTGTLIEGMIVTASGKVSLDEEAIAMMRRASPYPRAPETVPGERLEFVAPIEFMLPV